MNGIRINKRPLKRITAKHMPLKILSVKKIISEISHMEPLNQVVNRETEVEKTPENIEVKEEKVDKKPSKKPSKKKKEDGK